jgi:hydrogenase-1 operon protein HyaF
MTTRLEHIAVTVIGPDDAAENGNARALLRELEAMLERFVERDERGSIDLRSLPLLPGDYERLRETLGTGEVSALVQAMGATEVHETAIPGIWWVRHFDEAGEVSAELIEVTDVPEILKTHPADVRRGWEALRERLARAGDAEGGADGVR